MIVDAHLHLARPGSPAAVRLGRPATPDELLRQMDRAGITAAVVLGLPGYQAPGEVLELCRSAPDRLFPLMGVDPRSGDDITAIGRARELGFYGLKLHPRLNGVPLDDPRWDRILEAAAEHHLPVLFDAVPQSTELPLHALDYHAFDRLARRHRNVTMVLAHACAPDVMGAYLVAKGNPNVHIDVSFSLMYYAGSSVELDLGFLSDKLDRFVLYGSDFPMYAADEYLNAYLRLLERYPGVSRDRVLASNAINLFRLPLSLP